MVLGVQEDDKFDNHRQFGLMVTVAALVFLRTSYDHHSFSSPQLLHEMCQRNQSMLVLFHWVRMGGNVSAAWRRAKRCNAAPMLDKLNNYAYHTARATHQVCVWHVWLMCMMLEVTHVCRPTTRGSSRSGPSTDIVCTGR